MAYEGLSNQVSVVKESVIGTPETPTFSFPILESDGVQAEQEAVGVGGINTSPAVNKDVVSGVTEYNGSFEMNAYPRALGYLLKSALGGSSSALSGSETLVYDHTFTDAVAKTSMTLEQKVGSIVRRFAGFIVSGITIEMTVANPIKVTFEGKAMKEASESAITASYETSKVFDWSDIASITIGGTDVKCALNSLTIEYRNNLNNFHALCDTDPSYLYTEGSEVSGSFSGTLTTAMASLRTVFLAKTVQEIVATIIGDETIGDAGNNKLVLTMSKCYLNAFTTPLSLGYNSVDGEFIATEDATNGLLKAVLTNLVASY